MPASTKRSNKSNSGAQTDRKSRKRVRTTASVDDASSSSGDGSAFGGEEVKEESESDDEDVDGDEEKGEESEEDEELQKSSTKRRKKDDLNTRVVHQDKPVPAPKENPSTEIILPTTMEFLRDLRKHNDRDWFHTNDARYRHALENFTNFVDAWVPYAVEADSTLPVLPGSDLVMRIYRDMRFSKSQIPYKTFFSAGHSRAGRQAKYAALYIEIGTNGESLLGAGFWNPFPQNIKKLREHILRDPTSWRRVLSDPELVKHFGESTIFGHADELKKAPKMPGVTKDHPDIDLLRVRSPALRCNFTDEEVQSADFIEKKMSPAMKAAGPWLQHLNDIVFPEPVTDDDEGE